METKLDYGVKHALPGRIRVAFPVLIFNKDLTERMRLYLSDWRGITRVVANHYSGSITIYYRLELAGKKDILDILNHVARKNIYQPGDYFPESSGANIADNQPPECKNRKGLTGLCNVAGSFLAGVGILGVFLPLLPGIPLLLLAVFCYSKGSPKFYSWLVNLGVVGKVIKDFSEGKGLPVKAKLLIILNLWISIGISIILLSSNVTWRIVFVLGNVGFTIYILRIKPSYFRIEPPLTSI